MLLLLFIVAVITLLVFLHHYWFYWRKQARFIADMPGPKPYPFIGNSLEFGLSTVDVMKNTIRLWKEYGPTFRFWLGPRLLIFIADPKHAESILSSNEHITKNFTYRFLSSWLGDGLLNSTGSKWKHRRKIITPSFHFKILEDFLVVFNEKSDILIRKLKKNVNGSEFNMYSYITLCALDIICETAMGVSLNIQENSSSEYVKAVNNIADVVMIRTFSPWLFPETLFRLSKIGKREKQCLEVLHGTTNKVIRERREKIIQKNELEQEDEKNDIGQRKRYAFLDLLLQYTKDGANLTDQDIREEVDTFMFEGHDTTASGITFCLWLLALHEDIQEKVYDELKTIFGNSDRETSYRDIQDMKYLDCVIKESLRLYPSVPFFARELKTDADFNGLRLAAGTNLLVTTYHLQRHPQYFPEPDKFDPSRFETDNAQGRNPYAFIPFSAGPRNCIGQKFAMNEMKCMVSKVIRNFKLIPVTKELVLSAELVLRNFGGIYMKLENRI